MSIYNLVESQVYTRAQVIARMALLGRLLREFEPDVLCKATFALRRDKWYVRVTKHIIAPEATLEHKQLCATIGSIFTYAYTTSSGPSSTTFRVGSTKEGLAKQQVKVKVARFDQKVRTDIAEAIFNFGAEDLDVEFLAKMAEVVGDVLLSKYKLTPTK